MYSLPYIFFFFYLLFFSFPINTLKNNNHFFKERILFVFIGLIFFIGLRGYVFSDWSAYYTIYKNAPTLLDGINSIINFFKYYSFEDGFSFYLIIVKTISHKYIFFQCFSFIIDFIILYIFFKKYIPNYIILGFIFFYLFGGLILSINLFRNIKSILLFLISLEYCNKRKITPYLLLNILGLLFHISSLLYLPLYFLLNYTFSKKIIICIFILGNIIYLLQIQWAKEIIYLIASNINNRLGSLTIKYLDSKRYSSEYGITIGYIERLFTFFLIFIFYRRLIKNKPENRIFINLLFIYNFIFLYFSEISIILERLPYLFICSYWILYPQIYGFLSKKNKYVFLLLLIPYTILKLISGYNTVICDYDNILTGYKSYNERLKILNNYINQN